MAIATAMITIDCQPIDAEPVNSQKNDLEADGFQIFKAKDWDYVIKGVSLSHNTGKILLITIPTPIPLPGN
jgi:hypothetical protein